jgi:hypothetical protein
LSETGVRQYNLFLKRHIVDESIIATL